MVEISFIDLVLEFAFKMLKYQLWQQMMYSWNGSCLFKTWFCKVTVPHWYSLNPLETLYLRRTLRVLQLCPDCLVHSRLSSISNCTHTSSTKRSQARSSTQVHNSLNVALLRCSIFQHSTAVGKNICFDVLSPALNSSYFCLKLLQLTNEPNWSH